MQILVIHDSETEEIVGMVTPLGIVDFNKFDDEVRRTWSAFNDEGLAEDYSIEDFVDYHNENSEMQIDWVVSDFIQL
jgi:hypothetical protein